EELRVLSRRHEATLFMTLLAAWVTLVHRYSGNDEIVVGTAFANRNRVDVEESIGFFSNNLVLRHDLAGDPSFAELLRRVRKTTIEALSHGEMPLKLAEEPPAAVQLGFFMRSTSRHSPQLDGLEVERIDFDIDRGEYSPFLSLVVEEGDRALTARLYYDPNRFRAARVARTLEHLHALLKRVVTDPAQLVSTLPPATRPRGQTDWRALVLRARRRLRRAGRRTQRRFRRIVRRSQRRSRHVVLRTRGRLGGAVLRARRAAGRVRAKL
ncbi:MAG: condensation domain-containing protein, partial [Actinobacteria bacterium]|nr:condensation domain-containing protein [Actinomycetota bacterium]